MSTSKRITRALVCGKWVDAPDGDYFVQCSFDKNHITLRSRMPYHIVKCLKQNAGHTKIPCPYDFTEFIEREDIQEHIMTCEFRWNTTDANLEKAKLIASGKCGAVVEAPYFHDLPPPDEDWGGYEAMQEKIEEERKKKEEEERIWLEAQPEKVIDASDDSDEEVVGVGRGHLRRASRKKAAPPPKGMGRAEMFERLFAQYQDMKARGLCQPVTLTPSPVGTVQPAQPPADGQFEDAALT